MSGALDRRSGARWRGPARKGEEPGSLVRAAGWSYLPAMRFWHTLFLEPRGSVRTRFMLALTLGGPTWAAFQFAEVIARKSLDASTLMVSLLTMAMPLANFTAIWWSRILEGRDQRPYLRLTGLVGNLALISGLFLAGMPHMYLIMVLVFLSYAVQLTGQNRVLQQHIRSSEQGNVFGFANMVRIGMAALVAWLAGIWMDSVEDGYRHFFFVAGLFGLASTFLYASLPTRQEPEKALWKPTPRRMLNPLTATVRLLKRRPDYLRFEGAFMVYGVAFMMTLPTVPVFLVDVLHLDYAIIGSARGSTQYLGMIPAMWYFGRLFDRMTPHAIGARVFTALAGHPLLLIASLALDEPLRTVAVYASFLVLGVAMGGVSVLWTISSVRFAGEEDAGVYQAVHVAATAVRGSFAPLLAFVVMELFNPVVSLGISSFLWIVAGTFMARLDRTDGINLMPLCDIRTRYRLGRAEAAEQQKPSSER